jgi:hypothetical protein
MLEEGVNLLCYWRAVYRWLYCENGMFRPFLNLFVHFLKYYVRSCICILVVSKKL